jgi:hypothetical protein
MAGLVPAIHVFVGAVFKTWMPATSAGMTIRSNFVPQQQLKSLRSVARDGTNQSDDMPFHFGILDAQV